MTFDIFGRVTDDSGAPVAGAKVTVVHDWDDAPFMLTHADGSFRFEYAAVPGSNYYPGLDAPGTRDSIGFLQVEAPGCERFSRHILARGPQLFENVRLQRISRVAAGASVTITIRPEDTVCVIDGWPGRELTCGIVRVDVPADGVLRVEATPTAPGAPHPPLVVYGNNRGAPRTNPTEFRVTPGEYFVNVEVPWGAPTQSFVVSTSLIGG